MLIQLNRLMALMVLCGLLALMARPAQAEDDQEAWWPEDSSHSGTDYVPSEAYRNIKICEGYNDSDCFLSGELMVLIKEGNDELVDRLRQVAAQGGIEIGWRSWDQLAVDTNLIRIEPFLGFTDFGRRLFLLIFPDFTDKCAMYELFLFYSSLSYVDNVSFNEILSTTGEEMPSAISETTWGFIKHHGFSRQVFHLGIKDDKQW